MYFPFLYLVLLFFLLLFVLISMNFSIVDVRDSFLCLFNGMAIWRWLKLQYLPSIKMNTQFPGEFFSALFLFFCFCFRFRFEFNDYNFKSESLLNENRITTHLSLYTYINPPISLTVQHFKIGNAAFSISVFGTVIWCFTHALISIIEMCKEVEVKCDLG